MFRPSFTQVFQVDSEFDEAKLLGPLVAACINYMISVQDDLVEVIVVLPSSGCKHCDKHSLSLDPPVHRLHQLWSSVESEEVL